MIVLLEDCEAEVLARLARNEVIAVPGPRPFPYVLCAASHEVVNDAKGRQSGQSAILMLDDLQKIRQYITLNEDLFSFASSLACGDNLHVLLPHSSDLPNAYQGACHAGYLGVSVAWHHELRFMFDSGSQVFASSANASGSPPFTSASAIDAMFGGQCLTVVDPESDGLESHSGAIVRFGEDSSIELVRTGFQVEASGLQPEEYTQRLRKRWLRYDTGISH